jgi:MoaA/NifB/PqqE/SkfB family radical SAM enzyme
MDTQVKKNHMHPSPFRLENITSLHIEPTTVCNAACPQCAREISEYFDDQLHRHHLNMQQLIDQFGEHFLRGLRHLQICGVFGDPAAGQHTMDIVRWFRRHNPLAAVSINSNGGLRSTGWWRDLAKLLRHPRDHVTFSIDGLEDTNHLYRRQVQWSVLINNVRAFISAGGPAHWDMLAFAHNEHQIDQCEALARDLGFRYFRVKVSRRNHNQGMPVVPVSQQWQTMLMPKNMREHPDFGYKNKNNQCPVVHERSLYVAATGEVLPCCQLGKEIFSKTDELKALLATTDFQGIVDRWKDRPYSTCEQCLGDSWHTSVKKEVKFDSAA